jgi:pimeloyl-ACP methyl ester carboxylesterase
MAPLPAVRELHDVLSNSKWCLLERTGHMMNIERPKEFNKVLRSFYQEIT